VARAKVFTLGVPALAEFIGDIISPYTLLIAGHPGAGKTTLATTICYYNAIGGHKCLYVTFYEDKEKYYRNMKRLGLDLAQVESTGNFKFIRMPSTLDVELVVGEINELVKEGYDVVVIDSMTALIEPVASNPEKRAWLLNYFYQLPMVINGLLVLVAELPFGMERLELGSIEFVVDAIIVLKQRVEDGFLTRVLEVRKTRGAPIQVAEIPFSIVEDVGVKIYPPIVLKEVPPEGVEVQIVCKKLKESVGHYHRGFIINIFSPPGAILVETLLGILALAIYNKMKALVVSYIHPPGTFIEAIKTRLSAQGIPIEKVDKILGKYMDITALNPFGSSITELVGRELAMIESVKPDLVVFYGVHVARRSSHSKFLRELFNQMLYLKSRGIVVFRIGSCISEEDCSSEASIADITYWFRRGVRNDGSVSEWIEVYRRFRRPKILPGNIIDECVGEWSSIIRQEAEKL